jgi:hypothetical protein
MNVDISAGIFLLARCLETCGRRIAGCESRRKRARERAMSKKGMPPVPPAGRTSKGPGDGDTDHPSDLADNAAEARRRNLEKQGRQGNIKINTTNQGYQQDR